jgi:hypothetical protein
MRKSVASANVVPRVRLEPATSGDVSRYSPLFFLLPFDLNSLRATNPPGS